MVDSTGKYVTMTARRIEVRRNQKVYLRKICWFTKENSTITRAVIFGEALLNDCFWKRSKPNEKCVKLPTNWEPGEGFF